MPKTTELPFALESQAQRLFVGWAAHFREQDATLAYTHAEKAAFAILGPKLVLAGIIDAEGDDFFAEFKTANPKYRKTWKREWLLSTQALTYGLLTGGSKKFLVRKAFKLTTPEYDHEWFQFTAKDIEMWENQVHMVGQEIEAYRAALGDGPWPMNLTHGCFAYGPNYPCPFWQDGCTKNNFNGSIPGQLDPEFFAEFDSENRARLLALAETMPPDTIYLSATRIGNWQRCREMYRRLQKVSFGANEAMLLGSRFHELVAKYNRALIAKRMLAPSPSKV
jgi:hypothetical protein